MIAAGVILATSLTLHLPRERLGPANAVTLLRAVLVAWCAGHLALTGGPPPWTCLAAGAAALALDGVDGAVARRTGWESPGGARFDMQLDAFFTLALSALVWRFDRAGAWVLASGLMYYAFVAAARAAPWLAAPLPPRRRRKVVCALQVGSLVLALAPPLPRPAAAALAAAGLAALTASFAIDIAWLARRAPAGDGAG